MIDLIKSMEKPLLKAFDGVFKMTIDKIGFHTVVTFVRLNGTKFKVDIKDSDSKADVIRKLTNACDRQHIRFNL